MKQIFKLWYNPSPKKQSRVNKGFSISVEVDGVNTYFLNFMNVDSWCATTKAPAQIINQVMNNIPSLNQTRSDNPVLLADFTSKEANMAIPRWTCMLDMESHTPELFFLNLEDTNKNFVWTMLKEINLSGNRRHSHLYIDDYNKLELKRFRKHAA